MRLRLVSFSRISEYSVISSSFLCLFLSIMPSLRLTDGQQWNVQFDWLVEFRRCFHNTSKPIMTTVEQLTATNWSSFTQTESERFRFACQMSNYVQNVRRRRVIIWPKSHNQSSLCSAKGHTIKSISFDCVLDSFVIIVYVSKAAKWIRRVTKRIHRPIVLSNWACDWASVQHCIHLNTRKYWFR